MIGRWAILGALFPAFMQLVQTRALRTWPFLSLMVTFCTLGLKILFVTLWE
jgi:hypothetical protein